MPVLPKLSERDVVKAFSKNGWQNGAATRQSYDPGQGWSHGNTVSSLIIGKLPKVPCEASFAPVA